MIDRKEHRHGPLGVEVPPGQSPRPLGQVLHQLYESYGERPPVDVDQLDHESVEQIVDEVIHTNPIACLAVRMKRRITSK